MKSTLVFMHGALNNASVWMPVLDGLGDTPHLALNLPGHGPADESPLSSICALADWLWTELDARGVNDAVLIGHSMGSLIALEAAARQPARTRALVMVGTAFPMRVAPTLLTLAEQDAPQAIAMIDEYSRSQLDPEQRLLHLMQQLQQAQTRTNLLAHDLRLCDGYIAGIETAAQLSCPVHLVLGEQDRMTPPRKAAALAEAMRAQVHPVQAGHALMSEATAELCQIIKSIAEQP